MILHSGADWEILGINSKSFYTAHILPNPIQGKGKIRRGIRIWSENLGKN